MDNRLIELEVENFRSLRKVSLPLGSLNVLVGPNGAGKTNVLEVFRFLADVIRTDLEPALNVRGGFDEVAFWGGGQPPSSIRIRLKATWTRNAADTAPDEYDLRITRTRRQRSMTPCRAGRRSSSSAPRGVAAGSRSRGERKVLETQKNDGCSRGAFHRHSAFSSGLSTLPRLADDEGNTEVTTVAMRLQSFRVFDVNVSAARLPAKTFREGLA